MVTKVRMEHVIHCGIEAFWSNFLDAALHRRLFVEELGFAEYRASAHSEPDGRVRRQVAITPKLHMPSAVKAVLGQAFSCIEDGELHDGVYRFEMVAAQGISSDRASCDGVMRAAATPEGWTNRILELSIDVRMLGVGGMLESFAARAVRDTFGAHASALNAALGQAVDQAVRAFD